MKTLALYFLSLALVLNTFAQEDHSYYVSLDGSDSNPGTEKQAFRTIQKAIDEVAGSGKYYIYIKEGLYELSAPIRFNTPVADLSPELYIDTYKNQHVTVSGGRKIEGWKEQKNGWWVCEIPAVKEGKWKFKQIYVNGVLRQRARKPNIGFLKVHGMPEGTPNTVGYHTDCQSFEFAEGDLLGTWKNLDKVEVIVYHFWTDSHLPIESIDQTKNIVRFKNKAGKVFTDDFSEDGARYIVENVFEELDAPGEWYLDEKSGTCYYYPFPDENPNETEIFAPLIDQLIRFEGDPENREPIKNIHISNLEFCYTNWELPAGNSNERQGSASVPAAITLKGAQNCSFKSCRFFNLGTWAFELTAGCKNNSFLFNEIEHIGAGGFRLNGGDYKESIFLRTSNNRIAQNHIHHYGEVYPSAVGILLQNTEGTHVSQNLIHHGYYTGISIGWEWGYQRSVSRDNIIEFNHIHHIGQGLLSDMGGIYTLGVSPGTVLRYNLIHDVDANHYGGWGIYHDEGSTHILDENNIVYNTKFAAFNIHYAKEVTVRNNIFALGRIEQLSRSTREPHKSVYFEQNIVYWKEGRLLGGDWNDTNYEFYFHPKDNSGTHTVKESFDMDYNLYFNPLTSLESIAWTNKSWSEWQAFGKDVHSVYADPLFVNVDACDFNLKPESPAFILGFQAIDMTKTHEAGKNTGPNNR